MRYESVRKQLTSGEIEMVSVRRRDTIDMENGSNRPAGGHGGRGRRRRRGRRGQGTQAAGQGQPAQGAQQNLPGQQNAGAPAQAPLQPQGLGAPQPGSQPPGGQHSGSQQRSGHHHGGQQRRQHTGGPGQQRQGHGGQQQKGPRPPRAARPMRPARGPKHPDAELYSAPMDHSYRAAQNGNMNNGNGGARPRPGFGGKQFMQVEPEPLPVNVDPNAAPKIFAFIEDLFFVAKINETARKLNLKVQFVKTEKEITDAMEANGNEPPTLVIVDLNNAAIKPVQTISKLKAKFKKQTNVIGFLSHIQAELKAKAQEAGCDMVLPRSSFSANLPQLLRRHAAEEEELDEAERGM